MPRRKSKNLAETLPDVQPKSDQCLGLVRQTRHYKVITPLFGGGVETQEADPVTTVRAPEIRGQLRFWWRATRGGQFGGDLAAMKQAEDAIWGSAAAPGKAGPSPVSICTTVISEGTEDQPFEVVRGKSGGPQVRPRRGSVVPAYAAFPLQPEQKKATAGMKTEAVRVDVAFTLDLTFPSRYADDVEAALWAWEAFGGIGARTRRGFGALQLTKIDNKPQGLPSCKQVAAWLQEMLQKYVVDGEWPAGVPHLLHRKARFQIVDDSFDGPLAAWKDLISALKEFRQDPYGRQRASKSSGARPGRSYWPEPEAIRRLTGDRHPKHPAQTPKIDKFPRAQFGLPIIFHFKDTRPADPGNPTSRDPEDTSLQGVDFDRLASPLILRPLACAFGAVGLAAILEWRLNVANAEPYAPPGGLKLDKAPSNPTVSSQLDTGEAKQIKPLAGQTDVLQAFLDFL